MPRPFSGGSTTDNAWDLDSADTSTYNKCAELSWITLTVKGATASSPHVVLLFHNNEYVGTTTIDSFGFEPTVVRVDTSTLDIIYHYMLTGDSNAQPSGLAHSTYTWDFRTDVLSEHGDLPPGQK
ncbi:LppP/LprE family lipoprotein [Kocuria tytonis]|uniref:LppP/LprE family lipoprotein n=1 Tax=Kocuria tytonis TaxID=2054280 RepID=UPI00227747BB|nr:LppP/LprE family lipoprotein [Kocuria tytonis]